MPSKFLSKFSVLTVLFVLTIFIISACSTPQTATEPAAIDPPLPTNTAPVEEATSTPQPEPTSAPANTPIPESTVEPIMIVDGLDREVILPAPAVKVVSMAPPTLRSCLLSEPVTR